jgi:hypothetical protein
MNYLGDLRLDFGVAIHGLTCRQQVDLRQSDKPQGIFGRKRGAHKTFHNSNQATA